MLSCQREGDLGKDSGMLYRHFKKSVARPLVRIISERNSVVHLNLILTLCTLMSSVDNLCKLFGSRSGPTLCQAWSGSKLFDSLMVFLKNKFEKK